MSFILDALRKSEHERQRSTVPGLSHVPLAAPRRELPGWALAVIGLLAAAVLVLAGAWWQSRRPPVIPAATVSESAAPASATEPTNVATAARTTGVPAPSSPSTSVARTSPPRAAAPESTQPSPPSREASEPRVRTLASAAAAGLAPAPAPARGPTLPSVAALLAQGISVPPLRLELHAYSDTPANRFVFINGHKYLEGQRLAEGPEVVTIEPNGVVLSQQGQRFMLAPE